MTTIYEELKSDHDKHRDLLAQLEKTSGDSEERRTLWKTFYYDVGAHAAAEELTFYSGLIAKSDGQPEGRHSVAEHHELDEMIQELNDMDMSSPGWLTRFKTMKDRYEHHIEEEEEDIFPVAKDVIGADKSGKIAAEFVRKKKHERKLVDEKAEEALED
ncbi:MAG: hemerythrin [Hyphomonas sp. 34-62-18]|nr:hemerythrin domain-containing protein [Hyphomonas sp. 34-62-18]OZB14697.1 MAG: hemerythrin [Hyphomonas sp. 34-62-18]